MFHEYDVVRLKEPLPSLQLNRQTLGTIVMVYPDPRAYEVEFVNADGQTLALATLPEDALIRVYGVNMP